MRPLIPRRVIKRGIGIALAMASMPAAIASEPALSADHAASIERGRKLFIRCVACHAVRASAPARTGPHLEDIVGRPAAGVPGFNYTPAMRQLSFVWTRKRLERWLRRPQEDLRDLCLPFTGLPSRKDRQDLVNYLERPGG